MAPQDEPLQPTPFDAARDAPPAPAAAPADSRRGARAWVLPALGALVLLALVVVFWLPQQLAPPTPVPAAGRGSADGAAVQPGPATAAGRREPASSDASPWSEAQLAKLRKEAQEVLAQLLDTQSGLEERAVQRWAPQQFDAATASAGAGDELYRTRQYEAATARYREALQQMQALREALPGAVDELLQQARQAIDNGDTSAATTALELLGQMEPENAALAALQQRAAQLPRLLALLERAAAAEQAGDLAGAAQLLEQAVALDPNHPSGASQWQRVSAALRSQRFSTAMSEGYSALDKGDFDGARQAFERAARLRENSAEAASALQEVASAATAWCLAALQRRGGDLEQQEQWAEAVGAYEKARKIDPSVLFAQQGLQRSRERARLDGQLRRAIEDPLRLSDARVAGATAELLQRARQASPTGPVLRQQIETLQELLQRAAEPVAVTLRSDRETEVTVYKVARLGRFAQRELSLRPGTYTAVGMRNGYRDVRRTFTVTHDSAPPTVTIICTEAI